MGMRFSSGMRLIGGMRALSSGGGGGGSDPYFANVVLLVHGDGANGGTTFIDSSSYNRTPQFISDVTTSNEQTIFGQNTIKSVQGTFGGSVLQYASSTDFAANQPFTLEFQIYITSAPFFQPFFMGRSGTSYTIINEESKAIQFSSYPGDGGGNLTVNSWNYVAYSVNSTEVNLYINGNKMTGTSVGLSDPATQPFGLTNIPDGIRSLQGYLAEIRYTKGVARYSGATIPLQTAPWPNS
jgi:hypothetical protein